MIMIDWRCTLIFKLIMYMNDDDDDDIGIIKFLYKTVVRKNCWWDMKMSFAICIKCLYSCCWENMSKHVREQEKWLLYMKLHLWKTRIMPYHLEGRLTYSNLLKKYCSYNQE